MCCFSGRGCGNQGRSLIPQLKIIISSWCDSPKKKGRVHSETIEITEHFRFNWPPPEVWDLAWIRLKKKKTAKIPSRWTVAVSSLRFSMTRGARFCSLFKICCILLWQLFYTTSNLINRINDVLAWPDDFSNLNKHFLQRKKSTGSV